MTEAKRVEIVVTTLYDAGSTPATSTILWSSETTRFRQVWLRPETSNYRFAHLTISRETISRVNAEPVGYCRSVGSPKIILGHGQIV